MSIGSVIAGEPGTPNQSDDYPAPRPIDTLSSFSQRGPLTVAVAPGDKIGAAWLDNGHAYIQGTSMATPEVSGTVLLMQQMADAYLGRRLTWEEVKAVLQKTGDPVVDTEANMQDGNALGNTGLTYKRINLLNIEAEIKGMLKSPDASSITLTEGETETLNLGFGRSGTTVGTPGANTIYGSPGDERIDAGAGDDEVRLGNGEDQAEGGAGDDDISAGDGSDSLDGGQGNDTLLVEGDDNSLTGGEGDDRFIFANPSGENRISDFSAGDTLIIRVGADTANTDPQHFIIESIEPGTGEALARGAAHVAFVEGALQLAVGLDSTPGTDATFIFDGAPASAHGRRRRHHHCRRHGHRGKRQRRSHPPGDRVWRRSGRRCQGRWRPRLLSP
jgi:Ca2+-binding RTX toxin-like protein